MKQKLIVVGNGMVAFRFLEEWVKLGATATWQTICYGEEVQRAYDRIHLSQYFAGTDPDGLALSPADWYSNNNIVLHLNSQVVSIDRINRRLSLADGRQDSYDILVLASGSHPFLPPLAGIDRQGVFLYRTITDLDRMKAWAKRAKKAAVIGGGLLGLEAAKALTDLHLETTVIEYSPRLMPRQIDQTGSDFLVKKIGELGVKVLTGKQTRSVLGNEKVEGIEFADNEVLKVQMVVVSAGIRPRDELAHGCGIACGERGGIIVDEFLQTNDPAIYAIGECASAGGTIFGLAAPGYRMAETAAARILGQTAKPFNGADMSTKLKLMGVDVASIGNTNPVEGGAEVILHDSKSGIYKKLQLGADLKTLTGAILVGDASDYSQFLQLYLNRIPLPEKPETLLVKGGGGFALGVGDLPEDAVICSCNNVNKGVIVAAVTGGVHQLESLKFCTKAGTGCGSCAGMVKDILNHTLEASGMAVDKSICEHFHYTRQELFEIIKISGITTWSELLAAKGTGHGCEICKPVAASIFASLWHENAAKQATIQDTNDTYMANIQKNGTYGIIPRVPGGELTPAQLIAIGQVATDYGLYTKITGAQRIDMFGARLEDLPAIWQRLIDAGLESGQAYAKALRAVKSCVGSAWCRFGVQDSTAFAIELEKRYRGLRAPHKLKFGVSGCARECAEARGKDVGLIATEKGWNVYICGNGGMNPKHAVLLARDVEKELAIKYIDRFLIYYIRTADKLTRTAPWLEKLEGGIDKVREVVIDDSLGLAEELEAELAKSVADYECEWTATLKDPEKLKRFKPFINTDAPDPSIHFVKVRGQIQPAESVRETEMQTTGAL